MKIRFVGPKVTRRVVGPYEWSQATGFVQDVDDADLVAELLTDPNEQFVAEKDDALLCLDGIGEQRAAELALAGIATLADLAALDDKGIIRLDKAIWASRKQIRAWVQQAREVLAIPETEGAPGTGLGAKQSIKNQELEVERQEVER